ncbi:keratin-associated protein 6-2-like, partial [Daphnia carinata]|uniref:keratin-associated protein 6-2-like n=1 Tax=Daphnia carinata TaxID=120202 RepID=UPI002868BE3B
NVQIICLVVIIGAALADSSDRKSRHVIGAIDDGLVLTEDDVIVGPVPVPSDEVAIPTILTSTGPAAFLGGLPDQKTEEIRLQYGGGGSYGRPQSSLYYGRPYGGGYYGRPNGFNRPFGGFSRPYGAYGRQYTPNFGGYSQFGGLSNAGGVSNGQGNGNSGGGTVNFAGGYGSGLGGGYAGGYGSGYNAGLGSGYNVGLGNGYAGGLASSTYTTGYGSGFVPGVGSGFSLRPNYNFGK